MQDENTALAWVGLAIFLAALVVGLVGCASGPMPDGWIAGPCSVVDRNRTLVLVDHCAVDHRPAQGCPEGSDPVIVCGTDECDLWCE